MQHRKEIDGKRWYWYGWTDIESSADEAKEHLIAKGMLAKVIVGNSPEAFQSNKKTGYNTWYRPS